MHKNALFKKHRCSVALKLTHGELAATCDSTLLMSGSDLLEHMVCSSLIKSVSSSENTDKPMGSLEKKEEN